METSTRRSAGRPHLLPSGEKFEYVTVALTAEDKEAVDEWAWRLRKSRSQLIRDLVLGGLQPFRDNLEAQKAHPLPEEAPLPGVR